ncbi:MAG: hypothetical protein SFV52_07980 [Saprospiraceae bacterium]|nr:hypothetical protein [Saprospiraceae bacterium]
MPRLLSILSVWLAVFLPAWSTCQHTDKLTPSDLLAYFRPVATPDTLIFEVLQQEALEAIAGDTIPNALFFTVLDASLLSGIAHVADSAGALCLARQRFSLNTEVDACLVDIRYFWFQHQSLLLYDRRQEVFTDRVTVAEWYGGDGGQELTGSWLLDYNGDGQPDIIRRLIEHSLRMDEMGNAHETQQESAVLLLWQNGRFAEHPLPDASFLVKQFPIRSFW